MIDARRALNRAYITMSLLFYYYLAALLLRPLIIYYFGRTYAAKKCLIDCILNAALTHIAKQTFD